MANPLQVKEAPLSEQDGDGTPIFSSPSLLFLIFYLLDRNSEVFDLSFIYPKTYYSPEGTFRRSANPLPIQCHILDGVTSPVWIFNDFFTPDECDQLIALTDTVGYLETDKVFQGR